jgi:ribonuclease HI
LTVVRRLRQGDLRDARRHDVLPLLCRNFGKWFDKSNLVRGIGKSRRQTNAAHGSESESDGSDHWWKKYDIRKRKLDPHKNYVAVVYGVSRLDAQGTGIGIVLRDSDKIVWMAQQYYPKPRISFEATYCASVLALRFAVLGFGLPNLVVQVPDEVVHGQIVGTMFTEKVKQRMLREEIWKLQRCHVDANVMFQLTSLDSGYEAERLARESLEVKSSFNLERFSSGDALFCPSLTDDPMDDLLVESFSSKQQPIEASIDPLKTYYLRSDGASNGDPAMGSAGWVCYNERGQELWFGKAFLGENISAFGAELYAMHAGLSRARSFGIERIHCELDAKAVVEGFLGVREVELGNADQLWNSVLNLRQEFKSFSLQYIPRDLNKRANYLCKKGEISSCDKRFPF